MHDSETGVIAQSPRRRHTADAIYLDILTPSRFLAPCPPVAEFRFPEVILRGPKGETMSTAFRVYYLEDSGDWVRFPAKRYWDFYRGRRPIPEFAGETIRFVSLAVELVDRRPHEVLQHWPSAARVDDSGFEPKQDRELASRGGGAKARRAMDGWLGNVAKGNTRSESNLVDARDRFIIKAYEDQLVWEPNPRQLEALYDAVLSEKRGFSKKPVR